MIDGSRLDALVSSAQESTSLAALDDPVRERIAALIRAAPFKQMTFEHLVRCAEAMQPWPVSAGDEIVRQGEPGDYFYVLEAGHAEVVRHSAGGAAEPVAMLPAGATFGEEALLQGCFRNATVRMLRDGRLLRLAKTDFDRLVKSELVSELDPDEAFKLIERDRADIIDCRYEEEWELWRLPKARLIPLDQLRERVRGFDRNREYIVYCRTGRRSAAAAFLMRQMGLKAHTLQGGISAWPYAFEGAPLGA